MSTAEIPRLSRMLLAALVVLASPLRAQVEADHEPAPVGYWSLATDAYDPASGRPLQLVVIARFLEDGRFEAVLKTSDGSGDLGSSGRFRGRWEQQEAFGRTVICVTREDLAGVVCQYTVMNGGLIYANRRLTRHTADQVRAIAPELVEP